MINLFSNGKNCKHTDSRSWNSSKYKNRKLLMLPTCHIKLFKINNSEKNNEINWSKTLLKYRATEINF